MSHNEIFLDASRSCMILWKVKEKELKAFSAHRTWVWTVHSGGWGTDPVLARRAVLSPQLWHTQKPGEMLHKPGSCLYDTW